MSSKVLTVHDGLAACHRFPAIGARGRKISAVEVAALVSMGFAAAALSAFGQLSLGIPGHNIVRVVFPMVLGLALVPRYGAATAMGLSGVAGGAILMLLGRHGIGAGALTSLALTGVVFDAALAAARNGRGIYLRLAAAGLVVNSAAFLLRGGVKLLAGGEIGRQPLAVWLPKAALTYPLCGLLAGLICAAVLFRATAGQRGEAGDEVAA